jgi:hypothetical protein
LACEYLLEECAIFTQLCRDGWELVVYPGSIRTLAEIAEGRLRKVPEPIKAMVCVALKLKRGNLFLAESGEYAYAAQAEEHEHPEPDPGDDGCQGASRRAYGMRPYSAKWWGGGSSGRASSW